MLKLKKKHSVFVIVLIAFHFSGMAAIKLPEIVSDGMVLQRDARIRIWGWGNPGEKVVVTFKNESYNAITAANGHWELLLKPQSAGGPFTMTIKGENELQISDILIGDVWICSGQSNMAYRMESVQERYTKEIENSENSNIRHFLVEQNLSYTVQNDVKSIGWKKANPKDILRFSAVGYFFAKSIYEKYKIPVGIVNSTFGGTPVEGWMSADAMHSFPQLLSVFHHYKNPQVVLSEKKRDELLLKNWYDSINSQDIGLNTKPLTWIADGYDASSWKAIKIPGYWEDQGMDSLDRLVYFRKEIVLPENIKGKSAVLFLGHINGADTTYINGVKVGAIRNINAIRKYNIPAGLLKEGENNITVRVTSFDGKGGFVLDKPYKLEIAGNSYPLQGVWHYRVAVRARKYPSKTLFQERNVPTLLYNGMISPLTSLVFKGVLWYQGETDIYRSEIYGKLFPSLINNWRAKFRNGQFPFLFAQLPSYNYGETEVHPGKSDISGLREAQSKGLSIPGTGMITTYDIGEYNDIHPKNKLDVGKRFALLAEKIAYKEDIVSSGPTYKNMTIRDNKISISFGNTGLGLKINEGDSLKFFAVAGADKKFYWATAVIENNQVIVWSANVKKPVAVRYAWANNIDHANLFNKEGLPAQPFRTDNWSF
ncbi:sialate O-acetylesterase [Pedobacter sp. AK017]|uniref:sialate O-acetylesterase n=1 Tax=Pedobacter sp. AK017 TaxID=2723073 RepID=UPI00161BE4E4|nr:sialate O-acetylesterase [Pedobacter sp. AK017]MBB5441186.1 sialate O-acetylesterase [Pedobacter sp. AK017]